MRQPVPLVAGLTGVALLLSLLSGCGGEGASGGEGPGDADTVEEYFASSTANVAYSKEFWAVMHRTGQMTDRRYADQLTVVRCIHDPKP